MPSASKPTQPETENEAMEGVEKVRARGQDLSAQTFNDARHSRQEVVELLEECYGGPLTFGLVKLCEPRPHQHKARDSSYRDCDSIGKRPLETAWNSEAVKRYESGTDAQRKLRLQELARHLAAGGNVGLCPPPGTVVLDADTAEAAAGLRQLVPDDAPRQRTARGFHFGPFLLPPDAEIKATVGQELSAELEGGLSVDLRVGAKSQMVVAPSIHATGTAYEWENPLPQRLEDLPDLPAAIEEDLRRVGVLTDVGTRAASPSDPGDENAIAEGERNDSLFRFACGLRSQGWPEAEIVEALLRHNRERCRPPLAADEVRAIVASATRYKKGEDDVSHLTDLGNSERLVRRHGRDMLFCHPWRKWLAWDGRRWAPDETGEAVRRAKDAVRAIYSEAARTADEDRRKALAAHAKSSESERRLGWMLKLAQSEPGIPVRPHELDAADPWLLTVENGTLDLRTGALREHRREDRITKLAPVRFDPDAKAPLWTGFLERVLPDPDVRRFVQRVAGYTLTGQTTEQVLFILYGTGANGKTTFVETILALLGDYGLKTPTDTILARRETSIPNDVARLRGMRLAAAAEIEEGQRLGEVRIKELTGGGTVPARFMRGEWFDFRPVSKIWIETNAKPIVRGTDLAIWRRLNLLQFTVTIPKRERDKHLGQRLRGELPGILRWALDGCRAWQEKGLDPPDGVLLATDRYREEQDTVGGFLDKKCVVGVGRWVFAGDLHRAYRKWCEDNCKSPLSAREMAPRLEHRGLVSDRKGHGGRRVWRGVGLERGEGDG